MVIGKAKKDLFNSNGEAKEGMICEVLKVWINNIECDIYTEVKFKENRLTVITSLSNIEIIKNNIKIRDKE